MTARKRLPVVQSDEVYERNYAVRKAMVDTDAAELAAAIAACGPGADEYGKHLVHDKLGIEPTRGIYCRRDDSVWSPPAPPCDEVIYAQFAIVTTPSGVKYRTEAVTIPEGRFAEHAVTQFPRRYEVHTARFSMANYKPRTAEQLRAAAEARRDKAIAEIEAEERAAAEVKARDPQLALPLGGATR